jgi:hypothetical protein
VLHAPAEAPANDSDYTGKGRFAAMVVSISLWIAVAICAIVFTCSGLWQTFNRHAIKPALASGSPLRFGIAMLVFAVACALRGIALAIW